jgi:DNA primase
MYELSLEDPQVVLNNLGISHEEVGHDSYRMDLRYEKTPSAFISLRNGRWNYKDFGNGNNGSIVNLVMDYTGKDFKSSLNYCLDKLNVTNYLEEALHLKKRTMNQHKQIRIG